MEKKITINIFLLNIISSSYNILFLIDPYESKPIVSIPSKLNSEIIEGQILDHFESGAISIFPSVEGQHINRVFTVKKSNGKDRLIIDLSPLNSQIPKIHFRMEDHEYLKNLIRPGYFMASIDLSNAFFSMPLHEDSKHFCSFELKWNKYNFNVLPFDLTSSL